MKKEIKRIVPVPLHDAAGGNELIVDRFLKECISRQISVFAAIPDGAVAKTLGLAGHSGVVADLDDEETHGESGRILIDYSFDGSPVIDFRMKFVRLTTNDLKFLLDNGSIQVNEFTNGGLLPLVNDGSLLQPKGRGYELKEFDRCRLVRFARDGLGGEAKEVEVAIKLKDLFVDGDDASTINSRIRDALDNEDRWGHREEAPIVHLIYRAAQHFADKDYNFDAAVAWLKANDSRRFFGRKKKALEHAARIINRKPNKREIDASLRLDKIAKNEMGKDYTERIASNRLSLLHFVTDCWIHDRKHPNQTPIIPGGGLRNYLRDLGFKTTEDTKSTGKDGKKIVSKSPCECEVVYLAVIIEGPR